MSDKLQFVVVARNIAMRAAIDKLKFVGHSCSRTYEKQISDGDTNALYHCGRAR